MSAGRFFAVGVVSGRDGGGCITSRGLDAGGGRIDPLDALLGSGLYCLPGISRRGTCSGGRVKVNLLEFTAEPFSVGSFFYIQC